MKLFFVDSEIVLMVFGHGEVCLVHLRSGFTIYKRSISFDGRETSIKVERSTLFDRRLTLYTDEMIPMVSVIDLELPAKKFVLDRGGDPLYMYDNGMVLCWLYPIFYTRESTISIDETYITFNKTRIKSNDSNVEAVKTKHHTTKNNYDLFQFAPRDPQFEFFQLCAKKMYEQKRGNLSSHIWGLVRHYGVMMQ